MGVTGPARAVGARPNLTMGLVVLALVAPVRCGVVNLLGAVLAGRCPKGSAPPGLTLAPRRPGPGAVKGTPKA
jgi:hypothetical protein